MKTCVCQEKEHDPLPFLAHLRVPLIKIPIRKRALSPLLCTTMSLFPGHTDKNDVLHRTEEVSPTELKRLLISIKKTDYITTLISLEITQDEFFAIFPSLKTAVFFKSVMPMLRFSFPSRDQFSIHRGGSSCTAICLVAVRHFLSSSVLADLNNLDWNAIMSEGIALWDSMYSGKGRKGTPFFTAYEAYHSSASREIQTLIRYDSKEYTGTLFPIESNKELAGSITELTELFTILTSNTEDCAMVLTIEPFSFALLFNSTDQNCGVWFFDSHGGIVENKSTLIYFRNSADLVTFVQWKFCNRASKRVRNVFSCVAFYSNRFY